MAAKQLKSLSLRQVEIKDGFWKKYLELVRGHVIPYQWEALNDRIEGAAPSYCIRNMKAAAGLTREPFGGCVFQDSDLYKWLEAVAYSLMWHPDAALEAQADGVIDLMEKAQQPDGYLDTYYILNGLDKRFTNLMDNHELYCLGHMTEAAVAYYNATGKDKLLHIAERFIDCVRAEIGPEAGKLHGYPGHEVLEMALVALYAVTGKKEQLEFAKYLVDQRGQAPLFFEEECRKNGNKCHWDDSYGMNYYQAGMPVREQKAAMGHAVRAVYLYSGMADVAGAEGDESLFAACQTLWDNIVRRQMYITGSIGATSYGEAFTFDYDLPNDTAYAETCAAIGLVFFAKRMFDLTKNGRYMDVLEQALYNGVLSGMSLDGKKFFYVNPLEVDPEACEKDMHKRHVKPERQKWFGCACCPPNIARLISSIGGYAFEQEQGAQTIFQNLFMNADVRAQLGGKEVSFAVRTDYPWDGKIEITVHGAADFAYAIRKPGYAASYTLTVNGEAAEAKEQDGYLYVQRSWRDGDRLTLTLPLEARVMMAADQVREDIGKVAVMRGPLVYCLEQADNGRLLQQLYLDGEAGFAEQREEILGGVVTLRAKGSRMTNPPQTGETLYMVYQPRVRKEQELKLIPYYTWANRGLGEMLVWMKR